MIREYMAKKLFSKADEESIGIVDRAIDDLRKLGATIVDPGSGRRIVPRLHRTLCARTLEQRVYASVSGPVPSRCRGHASIRSAGYASGSARRSGASAANSFAPQPQHTRC